jgi:hypothetical protein
MVVDYCQFLFFASKGSTMILLLFCVHPILLWQLKNEKQYQRVAIRDEVVWKNNKIPRLRGQYARYFAIYETKFYRHMKIVYGLTHLFLYFVLLWLKGPFEKITTKVKKSIIQLKKKILIMSVCCIVATLTATKRNCRYQTP